MGKLEFAEARLVHGHCGRAGLQEQYVGGTFVLPLEQEEVSNFEVLALHLCLRDVEAIVVIHGILVEMLGAVLELADYVAFLGIEMLFDVPVCCSHAKHSRKPEEQVQEKERALDHEDRFRSVVVKRNEQVDED